MRVLLALAALLSVALAGCSADAGSRLVGATDCSSNHGQEVGHTADVLLPAQAPSDRPQVRVVAREGQSLTAVATWQADAGDAQVVFDGPTQRVVQTGATWTSTTPAVRGGTYTLSLEGAPVAVGVSYTLMLMAHGCTAVISTA